MIAQALYQIVVLLTLQLKGGKIFNVNDKVKDAMIFNIFFLCKVLDEFNLRKLPLKIFFKETQKNKLFSEIIGIIRLLDT